MASALLPVTLNVASSVLVVVLNKVLFDKLQWRHGATLTFLHSIATKVATLSLRHLGFYSSPPAAPASSIAWIASLNVFSVILMNANLQYNKYGVYQLCRLAAIPATAAWQAVLFGKRYSWAVLLSLTAVVLGVYAALPPMEIAFPHWWSPVLAFTAVQAASLSPIMIGRGQAQLGWNAMQLMDGQAVYTLPMLAGLAAVAEDSSVLSLGPSSGAGYGPWAVLSVILATCALAAVLNISGFVVIGKLSPLTYQVTSHLKTVLMITAGCAVLGEDLTIVQALGLVAAVSGTMAYGWLVRTEGRAQVQAQGQAGHGGSQKGDKDK